MALRVREQRAGLAVGKDWPALVLDEEKGKTIWHAP
jgi:hypothetical protein